MSDLPEVGGRGAHTPRTRVIILVTGRTAVSRVGGVTAVHRHVATAARLGLDPLVLYPSRMKALGAEISAELDDSAECIPADELGERAGSDEDLALVIAGDWYIAPAAIVAFDRGTSGPAVARFEEHGRRVGPLARIAVRDLHALIPKLADHPSGELIDGATPRDATAVPLPVTDRHRLSDNVAVERCEAKLFGWVGAEGDGAVAGLLHRRVSVPLTRLLVGTGVTPARVAAGKFVVGLLAAWTLARGSYVAGVAGAALYLASRVLDTVSGDLSRATLAEGARGEKADVVGDIIVMSAMLAALAVQVGGRAAWIAAGVAAVGVAISTLVAYTRIFRALWETTSPATHAWSERRRAAADSFASRFWRRGGLALALLAAAVIGRLDLFLWAAAVAAHLYYLAWLRAETEQRT